MTTTRMILLILVLVALFISPMTVLSQEQDVKPMTKIVMLGTGTPHADPNRSGPCVAIVVNDAAYLVDMGPGVVRRASAAHQAGIQALVPRRLKHVFVTHLHTDHTLGYPDPFVFSRQFRSMHGVPPSAIGSQAGSAE